MAKEKQTKPKHELRAKAHAKGESLVTLPPPPPVVLKKLTSYMPPVEIYRGLYTPELLPRLEEMAEAGYTNKEIAKAFGISETTFYEWKEKHPLFSHSLKKYRGLTDIEVENALYKTAVGFNFTEVKKERRKTGVGDDGKPIYEMVETEQVTKHVPGVPTAQIFYLKNRMPNRYKDKVEVAHGLASDISALAFAIKRVGEE